MVACVEGDAPEPDVLFGANGVLVRWSAGGPLVHRAPLLAAAVRARSPLPKKPTRRVASLVLAEQQQ